MAEESIFPPVEDPALVGSYPAAAHAGGGLVWDAVLEYRVWCHPERGAPDDRGRGEDYFRAFASYEEAEHFALGEVGAEEPIALIRQDQYVDESTPGVLRPMVGPRLTEWSVVFLAQPRRTETTISELVLAGGVTRRPGDPDAQVGEARYFGQYVFASPRLLIDSSVELGLVGHDPEDLDLGPDETGRAPSGWMLMVGDESEEELSSLEPSTPPLWWMMKRYPVFGAIVRSGETDGQWNIATHRDQGERG